MKLTVILSLIFNVKLLLSLTITPNNNPDPVNIQVDLRPDPRGINGIVNNRWKLDQDRAPGGILFDWGLVMTLSATRYGFKAGSSDSRVVITMNGACGKSECDGYFGFSIGGNQYTIYVIDFDGGYRARLQPTNDRGPIGIFGLPACGSSSILSGDIPSMSNPLGTNTAQRIRDGLAGGDNNNWYLINDKNNMNKRTFPVTFELINNDNAGTFTVKFSSATTSFTCQYGSAVATGQEIKMYFSPDDADDEIIFIDSLRVLCLDECGYEYVSEPKSFSDAESHCMSTFGRHLAEIETRQDRDCAIYKTGDSQAPWNGIVSIHKEGWFTYFDEKSACPIAYSGACVDFWVNGVPIDCKTGYKCTVFYPDQDGINNDQHCDSNRPFLCNDLAPVPPPREYIAVNQFMEWDAANAYCATQYGTTLATIITDEDYANFLTVFNALNAFWVWIGLSDGVTDGVWEWADGTQCVLDDGTCSDRWLPNEPDPNAGKHCAEVWPSHPFASGSNVFNEHECTGIFFRRKFICNAPTI